MRTYDFSNGSTNTYLVEERHHLIPRCHVCKESSEILFDGTEYFRHFNVGGKSVAESFPHLSPEHREILISGTHPECWDKLFGEKE